MDLKKFANIPTDSQGMPMLEYTRIHANLLLRGSLIRPPLCHPPESLLVLALDSAYNIQEPFRKLGW